MLVAIRVPSGAHAGTPTRESVGPLNPTTRPSGPTMERLWSAPTKAIDPTVGARPTNAGAGEDDPCAVEDGAELELEPGASEGEAPAAASDAPGSRLGLAAG